MQKLLRLFLSLWLLSVAGFALVNLLPGDPVTQAIGSRAGATAADVQRLKRYYGLDKPLPQRYVRWASRFLQGDWGQSNRASMPARDLLMQRLANTLWLFSATLAISAILFFVGFSLQGLYPESLPEKLQMGLGSLLFCVPPFWLGLLSLYLFAVRLDWAPIGGTGELEGAAGLSKLNYLLLPALVCAVQSVGQWWRLERPFSLALPSEGWFQSGQAKGMRKPWLLYHRQFKLASGRLLSVWALDLPAMLGSAIITETVFDWPGVARLLYDSVMNKDSDMAMACLLFLGFLTLLCNQLADWLHPVVDPRAKAT